MNTAKRALAVFLVVTAIVVAANLILTPVYHDGAPDYPVWKVVNWFMAAGVVIALVTSCLRRRGLGTEGVSTLDYLRVTATYYGAIVLTMLFFWGWIWTLNPDSETGEAVTSHLVYFPAVDALFVVIALATGRHLWRCAGDSKG